MRWFTRGLICLLFLSAVAVASPAPELVDFFSFEEDFEGWVPNGADLQLGSGTIPWSITRSQDMAKDGLTSVKLLLGNFNAEGKIWIQRPFTLQPSQTYQVRVSYFIAGPNGPGAMIAGALTSPPTTRADLAPFFEDTVTRGPSRWTRKQFEFTSQTDNAGTLFVIVGIWGAFEVQLVYYVDSIRTTFTMRQPGAPEPVINSADFNGAKKLTISGSAFGPSPRVIIDNVDRSDFITVSSDNFIRLKGARSEIFGTTVRVVDDTTAAASQPFILQVTN
jgi:hypothetical protein